MIQIAKTIPERQPEFRRLNWWERRRLGRYADRTRCRRCGGVKVEQVARNFGYSPLFTSRAVFGLGAFGLGFECCCEEEATEECPTLCDGSAAPAEFEVFISGVTALAISDPCTAGELSAINATFIIPWAPSTFCTTVAQSACKYYLSTGLTEPHSHGFGAQCTLYCIEVQIYSTAITCNMNFGAGSGTGTTKQFVYSGFSSGDNCLTIDTAMTVGGSSGFNVGFDFSSASANLRALT